MSKCENCKASVEWDVIYKSYDFIVHGYECSECGHQETSED